MKEKDQFEESINKSNETDYEMTQEKFDMWLELFDRLGQIVVDMLGQIVEDYTIKIWKGKNDENEEI
jgi:hypothetical protein